MSMVVGKPLFTVEQIQQRVKELAYRITKDYEGRDLVAVCMLRGAFMFFSDLVRNIQVPISLDFVTVESYIDDHSSGEVKVHCDLRGSIRDRDVLLVEDIVDSGTTLNFMRERLLEAGPRSLKICTLLDKRERREVDVEMDYIGYEIPNHFVVGYGLDYNDHYRNLPYIAVFKESK